MTWQINHRSGTAKGALCDERRGSRLLPECFDYHYDPPSDMPSMREGEVPLARAIL